MISLYKRLLVSAGLLCALATPVFAGGTVAAYDVFQRACNGAGGAAACGANTANPVPKAINGAISLLTLVAGIVAVIFVIVGGFKYILANGDAGATASAKNTILYALVGLAVVLLAKLIVSFVIGNIK